MSSTSKKDSTVPRVLRCPPVHMTMKQINENEYCIMRDGIVVYERKKKAKVGNKDQQIILRSLVIPSPENPGRNEVCWCGSGKKFKKCHGHSKNQVHY
jgi:hypothetical protein